jgi:hypothetical protein
MNPAPPVINARIVAPCMVVCIPVFDQNLRNRTTPPL